MNRKICLIILINMLVISSFNIILAEAPVEPNFDTIIQKLVWNGVEWADYTEVNLGEDVKFKAEIINLNGYPLNFTGYIYDHLPDNLRYINDSISIPDVIEHIDLNNNSVTWTEMDSIPPFDSLTFTYNAKAVGCGLGTNYIDFQGFYLIDGERIYVDNFDVAEVEVLCGNTLIKEFSRTGWNFFSLPFGSSILKDDLLVEYNGSYYELFDAANQDIVCFDIKQFNNSNKRWTDVDELIPGLGHAIIIHKENVTLYAKGNHIDENQDITIFFTGWNFFGVPCSESVDKSDLVFTLDGTEYNFDEAVSNKIIEPFIFSLNIWRYAATNVTLLPGEAYGIYSYKDNVAISIKNDGQEPTGILGGNVYEVDTEEPIEGACVVLEKMDLSITFGPFFTDETGFYQAEADVGNYNAIVTCDGYEDDSTEVEIIENCCNYLNFYLKKLEGDLIPPVTAHHLSGTLGKNDWYISEVTVSLDATDDESGVKETYYAIDRGTFQLYTESFILDNDGKYKISYYSIDNEDNKEPVKSTVIKIDKDSPKSNIELEGLEDDGWYIDRVKVSIQATDDLSDVSKIFYWIVETDENGNSAEPDGPEIPIDGDSVTFEINDEGYYEINYYAIDNAGNKESLNSINIKIRSNQAQDTTPPITTHRLSGTPGEKNWFTSSVVVKLIARDDMSGVDKTYFCIDKGMPQVYERPFKIDHQGVHIIGYYSVDKAGNVEETRELEIKIDSENPLTTYDLKGECLRSTTRIDGTHVYYYKGEATVTFDANDGTSGIDKTFFAINRGRFIEYKDAFTLDRAGRYVINYHSIDNAGNTEETKCFEIIIVIGEGSRSGNIR